MFNKNRGEAAAPTRKIERLLVFMKRLITIRLVGMLPVVVLAITGTIANAQQLQHPGYDTRSSSRDVAMSLDEATAQVRERTGGQVLSAKEYRNGERYYRFKVKKQGRVRVLYMRPDGSQFKPRR